MNYDDNSIRLKFDTRLGPRQWQKVNRSVVSGRRIEWPRGGVGYAKGLPPRPDTYTFKWSGLYTPVNGDEGGWVIQFLLEKEGSKGGAHIYRFWRFSREALQELRRIGRL